MVIKLVRTDATDVCKIQLPLGQHIIGRNSLLGCDDIRVSQYHGLLEVSEGSIKLTALDQNPCFFIKKDLNEMYILQKDNDITLHNGDKFGLLPDSFWYEIIYCTILDTTPLSQAGNISKNTEEYALETLNFNINMSEETTKMDSSSSFDVDDNQRSKSQSIMYGKQRNRKCLSPENYKVKRIKREHTEVMAEPVEPTAVKTEPPAQVVMEVAEAKSGPKNKSVSSTYWVYDPGCVYSNREH